MNMKVGDHLAVRSADNKVTRGYVTIEEIDHATGTVRMSQPVPAGTVVGDQLVLQEFVGLDRK
jgi:hypothetical protein